MFRQRLIKNSMRVVGLISGGKDSIYNVLQCIAAGHDVVAFANISPRPNDKDELDSFMYQTVGHEGISLIAKAAGLPIFRNTTSGKAKWEKLAYEPTHGDEVEDLYNLLSQVKQETGCEGVAVGAIASDYQRTRVENVCSRLGLTSFAYLWHQDQSELLQSMIKAGIHAVTIKVASAGLDPNVHLGLRLEELEPIVEKLNKKFGVNVCGEGGEYETFVLDCPLFHQKIILDETHVTKDATSGYLSIKSARLEPKFDDMSCDENFEQRRTDSCRSVSCPKDMILDCLMDIPVEKIQDNFDNNWENVQFTTPNFPSFEKTSTLSTSWLYLTFTNERNIEDALTAAKRELIKANLTTSDIAFVSLWLRDMKEFAEVNRLYVKALPDVSPARACVATLLDSDKPIALELTVCKKSEEKKIIHVQSVSHWAPANIGPYSQCYNVGGLIFVAGQIPLIPGSMTLAEAPLAHQLRLALRHVQRILETSTATLDNILQLTVFVSKVQDVQSAVRMVKYLLPNKNTVVSGMVVSALPRLADVELLAVAAEDTPTEIKLVDDDYKDITCHTEFSFSDKTSIFVSHVFVKNRKADLDPSTILKILTKCLASQNSNLGVKVFYNPKITNLEKAIRASIGENSITIIPIERCESPDEIMTISGISVTCS